MNASDTDRNYVWDAADQLKAFYIQAGTSEPSIYAQYLYSGGQRIKKIVRTGGGDYEVTVYDGPFEYCKKVSGSTTYEKNYSQIEGGVEIRTGTAFPGDISDSVVYTLGDNIGSSNLRLSTTGTIIDKEEYYPFGDTSLRTFTYKRYRYVGKEKDSESGLYYYGARYYASWTCRFISVDPLAAQYAHLNPYNYADNNPINDLDIDGMQTTQSQRTPETGSGGTNPEDNPSFCGPKLPKVNSNDSGTKDSKMMELRNKLNNLGPKVNIEKHLKSEANKQAEVERVKEDKERLKTLLNPSQSIADIDNATEKIKKDQVTIQPKSIDESLKIYDVSDAGVNFVSGIQMQTDKYFTDKNGKIFLKSEYNIESTSNTGGEGVDLMATKKSGNKGNAIIIDQTVGKINVYKDKIGTAGDAMKYLEMLNNLAETADTNQQKVLQRQITGELSKDLLLKYIAMSYPLTAVTIELFETYAKLAPLDVQDKNKTIYALQQKLNGSSNSRDQAYYEKELKKLRGGSDSCSAHNKSRQ
ncbi:MAG: RHS repeat-associated core domain-containing protein [Bacteroidota bacterium]